MLAIILIIAGILILALVGIAFYAIEKWKYYQERYLELLRKIGAIILASIFVCSCNITKFTTYNTQMNFFQFQDTINWKVKDNKLFMITNKGKFEVKEYTLDSCKVEYKIDKNINVKHW